MKPPVTGPGALLWLFPLLIAVVLGISAFLYLKHRRREALPPLPKMSKQDNERVRAAREGEQL
jgi:cytochrome c-type biogenesis protein CcmH/NrfF